MAIALAYEELFEKVLGSIIKGPSKLFAAIFVTVIWLVKSLLEPDEEKEEEEKGTERLLEEQ